jgi:hypothetical protein
MKAIFLLSLVLFFLLSIDGVYCYGDRQKLIDIQALTFQEGEKTTGRRSSPMPQLNCVGGAARNSNYLPSVVQCVNKGNDGFDVQWECKADLDEAVKFGKINVNCEGYDHSEDPYILKGSCALEYHLDYTRKGSNQQNNYGYNRYGGGYQDFTETGSWWGSFFTFIVLVFVIYNIFRACAANNAAAGGNVDGGYGQGYGGGPGYGGGYGSGYGGGPGCAPSYTAAAPGTGGGFWTGMATGGLLSYLFRPNYGYRRYGYGGPTYGGGSGYFGGGGFGGGGSVGGGSRMSSGFGGTKRR